GKQSRDFTYIDNVILANYLAATVQGIQHEVVNVANGESQTVLYLVETLNKILGKKIQPKLLPVRAGDVFKTEADISHITKVLKYKPTVSFEQGLEKTVAYFQKKYKNGK